MKIKTKCNYKSRNIKLNLNSFNGESYKAWFGLNSTFIICNYVEWRKSICIYLHIKLYPSTQNEITTVWCLNQRSEVLLLNAEQQNIRENSSSQILLLLLTSSQKIRFYLHRELKQHIEPSLKVLKLFREHLF